jgi:hypothetical protein
MNIKLIAVLFFQGLVIVNANRILRGVEKTERPGDDHPHRILKAEKTERPNDDHPKTI